MIKEMSIYKAMNEIPGLMRISFSKEILRELILDPSYVIRIMVDDETHEIKALEVGYREDNWCLA